jgi:eukaryotic-like serine/threonine-protein kinase
MYGKPTRGTGNQEAMAGYEGLTFAALLKRLRRLTGLTQEELAERAGYSPAYISALERGVRTPLVTTAELLADSLDLEPEDRARLMVAGRRETLQSRRGEVPGHSVRVGRTGPALVGRAREMARIEQHFSGQGAPVLLLTGEPGIGKSRLVQEAAVRAAGNGYTVLQAGWQRHSARQAYSPLIDAVTAFLEHLSPAEHRHAIEGCDWLVRLIPELADAVQIPSIALPPEQERRLAFRALGRLLRNVAGPAGTFLLLDDLHWAGQDALDLLASLVYDAPGSRLSVIAAYRDTELSADSPLAVFMADLASARLASHLALGPLTEMESLELLRALLTDQGQTESGQDTRHLELLARRAEGVAFFLVSSAENLKHGVEPDEVPWDMAQVIRQRVAMVPLRTRELLGVAAVAGRAVNMPFLTAVSGLAEGEVLQALEMASGARLLEQSGDGDYRFGHDVVREVVESDLVTPHRMVLHRHIAEVMEKEGASVELLAYHYARGGQIEKAIVFLEQAGDKARSEHAYAASIEFYRDLLERLGQLGRAAERARTQEKLGEVLLVAGRYDEAIQVLEEAAETHQVGGDVEGEARTVAKLGHVHFRRGTAANGIHRLELVLDAIGVTGSEQVAPRTLLELAFGLTRLYYAAGRIEESLAGTQRMAELARRVDDASLQAEAELARGIVLCALNSPVEGARIIEASLPAAERTGAVRLREDALQVLAGIHLIQGELDGGRLLLEQAIALAEAHEDPATLVVHLALLARFCFVAGDWQQAHIHLSRAVDIARSIGPAWYTLLPLAQLGVLLQAEGDWEGALHTVDEILAGAGTGRVARGMPLAVIVPAQIDILRRQPELAAERIAPLLPRAESDWAYGTLILTTAAWAHLELQDGQAAQLVEQALALAEKTSNCVDRVGALCVQAMILDRRGVRNDAERLFAAAVSLASRILYPYAQGRTLYEWGMARAGAGKAEDARKHVNDALTIFQQLGARKDIEATERALERLPRD